MQPLTSYELEIVNNVEQYWHQHSKFPPDSFFKGSINLLEKPAFKRAMAARGISINPSQLLTKEQMAAVLAVTNYLDRRSQGAKLKALGISPQQWGGWLRNQDFKKYLHEVSSSFYEDALHVAQDAVIKKVEQGDMNAVKFYMESTNRYNSNQGEIQNLRVIIAKLVEVLQRRVTDPEILNSISHDFNLILNGQDPVQYQPAEIERLV